MNHTVDPNEPLSLHLCLKTRELASGRMQITYTDTITDNVRQTRKQNYRHTILNPKKELMCPRALMINEETKSSQSIGVSSLSIIRCLTKMRMEVVLTMVVICTNTCSVQKYARL